MMAAVIPMKTGMDYPVLQHARQVIQETKDVQEILSKENTEIQIVQLNGEMIKTAILMTIMADGGVIFVRALKRI